MGGTEALNAHRARQRPTYRCCGLLGCVLLFCLFEMRVELRANTLWQTERSVAEAQCRQHTFVQGFVLRPPGVGAANVKLRAVRRETELTVPTESKTESKSDGSYCLEPLLPGRYRVELSDTEYVRFIAMIDVYKGDNDRDFEVNVKDPARAATIETRIMGRTADVSLSAKGTILRPRPKGSVLIFEHVRPGNYTLQALTGTRLEEELKFRFAQSDMLSILIDLPIERASVQELPPLVDTHGATISSVVEGKVLSELPLNGRDLYQLALLQPGVARIAANAFPSPWQDTTNGKFAVNGMRPSTNTTIMDGADVSDPGHNQPLGGPSGAAPGVDSTEKFESLTNMYGAEFGRNGGAVLQLVTRSGSNSFHGSAYEFLRNNALDAKNFFDRTDAPIPELRRNQFGFTLGGPFAKDRTFFFVSYDGTRERTGETQSFVTPTAGARLNVVPEIAPYLSFYPLPNDSANMDLGDGTGVHKTSAVLRIDENYFVARFDHALRSTDQFVARYLLDDGESFKPFMSTPVPGFNGVVDARSQLLVLKEQHIFSHSQNSQHSQNEFQVALNRIVYNQAPARVNPGLSIALGPVERPIGQINVGGLPPLGHALTLPAGQFATTYQLVDNATLVFGRNLFKVGVDIRRPYVNGPFDLGRNGSYTFFSLPDFVVGNVAFFLGTSASSPDSSRGFRQTNFGSFVQDEYHGIPKLTVNMGLRYEYNSSPSEQHNRLANIRRPLTDTSTTIGDLYDAPGVLLAPRLGLAWAPFGGEKTAIRTGVGIFYDLIKENIYGDTRWLPPFYDLVLGGFGPGSFRNLTVILPFGTGVPIPFKLDQPYALSYNLQIQQELGTNERLTLAYVGSRGNHLTRSGEANTTQFTLVGGKKFFTDRLGPRLNPAFGSIFEIATDAQSFYNSFQVSILRRLANGFAFQGSYTLAKSIDDTSGPLLSDFLSEVGPAQDFYDRNADRSFSAFDVRHNFIFNMLYELPVGPGKPFASEWSGPAGQLVRGWQVGGILSLSSGSPFTVRQADNRSRNGAIFFADRPNLTAGGKCRITGNPNQWFDLSDFTPATLGFYGTAGRNICRGPDYRNLDLSIRKDIHLTERVVIEFRTESFNLTNHPNFSAPVNTPNPNGQGGNGDAVFAGSTLLPSAGRIFRTANTSRQVQFAVKLRF